MNQVGELKRLARDNQFFWLKRSGAEAADALIAYGEVPLLVVIMRDVWASGARLSGVRPLVVVTDRQVIVLNYASRWRPPKYVTFNRSEIKEVSDYSKRAFEMTLANGTTVKMRGLIGGKTADKMPLRLYELLSKK
jgi:hypothetical protein